MIDREGLERQFLFAITQIERDVRVTEMTLEEHLLLIDAILSGIDRQGYVIVPKVPTEAMLKAGMRADAIDPDHEHDCPMQSPAPNAICNCGNPKAIKWDAQGCRFWSPHYDTPQSTGVTP